MRMLGDLVLPDNTLWENRVNWSPVRRTSQRTTGGGIVYTHQKLYAGQPITLNFAQEDWCLTFADVEKIRDMASRAGESFSFMWDSVVLAVVFDEPPHELSQCFQFYEAEQDYFFGKINLLSI